jgi:hypothetical protein
MSDFLILITLILCTSLAFPVGRLFPVGRRLNHAGGRLATVAASLHQPIFQSPSFRSQILRLRHDSNRDDLTGNHAENIFIIDYNRKLLATDCEMVGVRNNTRFALARVSIVDYNGQIVLNDIESPRRCARNNCKEGFVKNGEIVVFDINPRTGSKFAQCRACKTYVNNVSNPLNNPLNNKKVSPLP